MTYSARCQRGSTRSDRRRRKRRSRRPRLHRASSPTRGQTRDSGITGKGARGADRTRDRSSWRVHDLIHRTLQASRHRADDVDGRSLKIRAEDARRARVILMLADAPRTRRSKRRCRAFVTTSIAGGSDFSRSDSAGCSRAIPANRGTSATTTKRQNRSAGGIAIRRNELVALQRVHATTRVACRSMCACILRKLFDVSLRIPRHVG
jgi:hypothetical protein